MNDLQSSTAKYGHTVIVSRKGFALPKLISVVSVIFVICSALVAQEKHLWVLRAPGEVQEYDSATFAPMQTVKVPAEAVSSPEDFSVNRLGQMLFEQAAGLPLAEGDLAGGQNAWFWNGHEATDLSRGMERSIAKTGSNLAISETAASPVLSADGSRLFWFANRARRLQRDGVDLSTKTSWLGWQTDLAGAARREIASATLPDCSCPTGGCEETCPYVEVWAPEGGIGNFFLVAQFIAGKTQPVYKSSSGYEENRGQWNASPIDPPLHRVLDATSADAVLEAVPDTACCGWSNQSDDRTLLHFHGKTLTVFDERGLYNNPDYDVSFFTETGKLSPDVSAVAFTIAATAKSNQPIQLADQGQGNPEESRRIRKALAELPAVEVRTVADAPQRLTFLAHAELVGWLTNKEMLIVEEHMLVAYNVNTKVRRKLNIRVEDAAHVFLR